MKRREGKSPGPVGAEEVEEVCLETGPAEGTGQQQLVVVAQQHQVGQVDALRVRGLQVTIRKHNLHHKQIDSLNAIRVLKNPVCEINKEERK